MLEERAGLTPGEQVQAGTTGPAQDGAPATLPWLAHGLYQREFLALPIMAAGMTAMRMTPGPGTWVLDSTGAGGQTDRLVEGFLRSRLPACHGSGSQAGRAQGQEGLGVPCLRLCGDLQAEGRRPPSYSPKPHALSNTSASTGH